MNRFSHFKQAIVAAIIGTLLTLSVTTLLRYIDNKHIRKSLNNEIMAVQSEIAREVQSHMFGLAWVARQHASNSMRQGASWLNEGPIIRAYYPNFRFFLWVNEQGVIEAVHPSRFADEYQGKNFTALTGESLTNIQHNGRYLLSSGKLQQDPSDMLMLTTHLTGEPRGYYVAVVNNKQLLTNTMNAHLSPGSQFQIINPNSNEVIFNYSHEQTLYSTWRVEHTIQSFNQSLTFVLWPSTKRFTQMRSNLPLLFLIAGLFSTALLTSVLYVLAISRVRAQELADTNLDLYMEIEERERVEQRMTYLASHDSLTGLINRRALLEQLHKAMHKTKGKSLTIGVLLIDLDNFKDVNDALGHTLGDELLKAVAQRLSHIQPSESTLARLGGDEFAITLLEASSIKVLEELAERVLLSLKESFIIDEYKLTISASIGIAIGQSTQETADDLMRNADTALYRAKELGRDVYHVYSQVLHKELNERIELMKRLREAVDNEKLSVFYQPKIDMQNRRIIGFEALVRWIEDDGSIIGPDTFIPLAEDTGLILNISNFVLKEACRQLKVWHDMGFQELHMSVNLSGKQLKSPHLIYDILEAIHEAEIPNEKLELELTEQVFIENIKSHTNFMHAVRDHGMTLAIDDFGVGYSSLSYLKHFPVNVLKIDRSFVQDLPEDKDDATITQTIINLANNLDIGLVAEGVETEEQVDFLLVRGCYVGQGFLFSRPIAAQEMTELLKRYKGFVPIQIDV